MTVQGPYADLNTEESFKSFGAGGRVVDVLYATETLDFPSIAANTAADLTVTMLGARANDIVHVGPPAALESAIQVVGLVTADDTVTVRAGNNSAGAVNPVSALYRITVTKFDVGV